MNLAPDNEPALPGLTLQVTDEERARLLGKWIAVDDEGHVKASGADFEEVDRLVREAKIDLLSVSFAFLPQHGLMG